MAPVDDGSARVVSDGEAAARRKRASDVGDEARGRGHVWQGVEDHGAVGRGQRADRRVAHAKARAFAEALLARAVDHLGREVDAVDAGHAAPEVVRDEHARAAGDVEDAHARQDVRQIEDALDAGRVVLADAVPTVGQSVKKGADLTHVDAGIAHRGLASLELDYEPELKRGESIKLN